MSRVYKSGKFLGQLQKDPSPAPWITSVSLGIYNYLSNTAFAQGAPAVSGSGLFGAAHSLPGAGSANEAYLGISALAVNDKVGGSGGAWGFYSTVKREAGVLGPTHGMEVDVANMGTLVTINPFAMVAPGQTNGLWIATGGETTLNAAVGVASCAVGIIRNDSAGTPSAAFEKGIVFDRYALSGCNGVTGTAVAVGMARGHLLQWYGAGGAGIGYIANQTNTVALATSLNFDDNGTMIYGASGPLLQVPPVASSANYPVLKAVVAGGSVKLSAAGSDANIDIFVETKGSGVLGVTYGSSVATTPSAFSATRRLPFKDGNNILWYIPVSTVAW